MFFAQVNDKALGLPFTFHNRRYSMFTFYRTWSTTAKLTGLLLLILVGLTGGQIEFATAASTSVLVGGWQPITTEDGVGTSGQVITLLLTGGTNLYVGGNFETAGGVTVNDIALWNGSAWSGFSGPSGIGITSDGYVNDLAFNSTNDLYITGSFGSAGGLPTAFRGNGAKWNGTAWSWLDPTDPYHIISAEGHSVVVDSNDDVYFGGFFFLGGNSLTQVNRITRYDDATVTFAPLADATTLEVGTNNTIFAVALDANENVYVAGNFTSAGNVTDTVRIAMYDGTNWLPLGAGIDDGQVNTLVFDSLGNLYAGGTFTSVNGGTAAGGIAMWDGVTWTALGSGVTGGGVNAIAFDAEGGLYVGGSFTSAGGVAGTARLARWNNGWHALPEGTPNDTVKALQYDPVNDYLYVGGLFTHAGSPAVQVNHIAMYQPKELYELTVDTEGLGEGEVASNPTGIDCGASCTAVFLDGTVVTLTATAGITSTFAGWSGDVITTTNPLMVTMDAAKHITATFTPAYTIALNTDPVAGGVVSGGGVVAHGTLVTVTAVANTGYTFVNWMEGEVEVADTAEYSFTAMGHRTLTAHFEPEVATPENKIYLPFISRP